jgi:membrane protein implicated in regulation of membrane protease activity
LVAWAIFTTPEDPTVDNATAVGSLLVWGYTIAGVAIVVAVFAAIWDLIQKPTGLKGTIIAGVAVVAIILGAYFIANGHDYQILDIGNQTFFERGETVIADASILVAYVAGAGAIISAIYSAISDALK